MIQPEHATFEQSKLLKAKGFDKECKYYYDIEFNELAFHSGYIADTYKNSELVDKVSAPEQWQVVEWLWVNHDIWVFVYRPNETGYFAHNLENKAKYDSPQEAYSAAFDYVLNNLI